MPRFSGLSIEQIVESNGPLLSTELCKLLEAQGLSALAARQRISRVDGPVKRLPGLVFPRGARFLYHQSTFNSHEYWEALLRDIDRASPAYAPAIASLRARGGIVPLRHFGIISGCPIRQKGQVSSETVLERLLSVRIVESVNIPGVGECVTLAANGYFGRSSDVELRARLLAEKILLLAVKDWARKLGVASYDKVKIREDQGDLPRVGTFHWDLTAPSYLRAIVRRDSTGGKPKPGFLVCDALTGSGADEAVVAAFVRKCRLLSNLRNTAPVLPILIADRFSREAFRLGRSQGVILATPATLFGRDVAIGLASLLQTLTRAAAVAVKRPEVVGELFDKLSQIEGAASNLRGALFELLVGHCVVKNDDGLIDIGKRITDRDTGETADIDVFRIKEHREVWGYECKGHQPSEIVSKDLIEDWLTQRVARVHRVLAAEARFRNCAFHYQYWTCGSFAPDALALLRKMAGQTKKYSIGWKDGQAVRAYASRVKPKAILDILDQHFFKHPITKFQKRNRSIEMDATAPSKPKWLDEEFEDLEA